MVYWSIFLLMTLIRLVFVPSKYLYRDKFPKKGGFIIASNHVSNLDPFILGLSRARRFGFMAKEELFSTPWKNFWFRGMGAYPVKRGASDMRAMRETFRRLKQGVPIILFPEGTRQVKGKERQIQSGVGFIAQKASVPVVPAYIHGSNKALPHGAKFFTRHKVEVIFGEPMTFAKEESYEKISHQIMDEIAKLAKTVQN